MQNKTAIWAFTILLAIASIYQLSFSYFTSSFENKAIQYAEDEVSDLIEGDDGYNENIEVSKEYFNSKYVRENGNESIFPLFGFSYNECKDKEIKKGLDLEGGMSVTLEVSVPDLVSNLAANGNSESFKAAVTRAKELQLNSDVPFIDLFARAWDEINPDASLAKVFSGRDNADMFPYKSTNAEIIDILKEEAKVAISNTEKIIRTRIDRFGVTQPTIQKQQFSDRIIVELPGVKDRERVRNLLKSTANLEFWETYDNTELIGDKRLYEIVLEANDKLSGALYPDFVAGNETKAVVDSSSISDLGYSVVDGDTILDSVEDDEEEVIDEEVELTKEEQRKKNPLRSIFGANFVRSQGGGYQPGTSPVVGYAAGIDTARVNELFKHRVVRDMLPMGGKIRFAWSSKEKGEGTYALYAIKVSTKDGKPRLDGGSIVDARQEYEQFTQQALVSMRMDSEGAKIWQRMTKEAASATPKKCIAILLDGAVQSAPVVNGEIAGGNSQITMGSAGKDNISEAIDLANLLKAGALPAPANIVDEQVIGPSLGKENINKALMAFALAFLVVLVFMAFYYAKAGVVADIALIANVFFLMGALASLQASLTLPGIAGIILTLGMAVDANVLIFERIKEEMRLGAGLRAAIDKGYKKAYSAILDANITTMVTAIVLLVFGSGPIKGFATTLIIGIITSLFSAIFLSRLIIGWMLDKGQDVTFFTKATKNFLSESNFQFVKKRKLFYGLSAVIIIIGLGSLFTRSLDYGVDFAGGRTYDITFDSPVSTKDVKSALSKAFIDDNGRAVTPQVKRLGTTGHRVKITTKYLIDDKAQDADKRVESAMLGGLTSVGTVDMDAFGSKKVDPTISDDFASSSLKAVFIALLFIFLYIVFRFRKWQFGLGALVALTHDVLIVLGIYSLFWGILPFTMEIDQAFIAAILTVVGYSINDTVVVFDRIREYLVETRKGDSATIVNKALNSTISRTVITSLSTFLVLLMIFIFGSDSIKGFTFALMVGVVVGTYSSLFIATPLVVDFSGENLNKEMRSKIS